MNFDKGEEAAVRVNAGATATFKDCHFQDNEVSPSEAGPAIGLRSSDEESLDAPSFVWLSNCTFRNNLPLSVGDVSVRAGCRVFSDNAMSPVVFDRDANKVVGVWRTEVPEGAGTGGDRLDASLFATEGDGEFQSAVAVRPARAMRHSACVLQNAVSQRIHMLRLRRSGCSIAAGSHTRTRAHVQ